MQITIKVLKGNDCTINVTSSTTVLEIKNEIERRLDIPHESQKLLLLGRTLNDELTLGEYPNIKEGTKLNLIVMKSDMRDLICRAFRKYYNENQSERLTKEFMADLDNKLKDFSMDDIERLVENIMFS